MLFAFPKSICNKNILSYVFSYGCFSHIYRNGWLCGVSNLIGLCNDKTPARQFVRTTATPHLWCWQSVHWGLFNIFFILFIPIALMFSISSIFFILILVQVQVVSRALTSIITIFILMIWPYWQIGRSDITTSFVSGIILMIWLYWQIGHSGITLLFNLPWTAWLCWCHSSKKKY
jgi:hypothetical protein